MVMGTIHGAKGAGQAALWVLAALFAMNLLNYIDRFILAAVLQQVQEELNIKDAQGGLLSTAFLLSYAIFSPFTGWLGDRWPRKYLVSAGVGVWSLATFGSGLVTTSGQMMAARCFLGIGEASYATLAPSLIGDFFRRGQRNRALTIFYLAIPIGAALGYFLGGQIAAVHGWRVAFFAVGLPGLAVAIAALAIPEPRRGGTEEIDEESLQRHEALPLSWGIYAKLFRNKSYLFNAMAMAMFTFALGGLQLWAPKFLAENRIVAEAETKEQSRRDANARANTLLAGAVGLSGLLGTGLGGLLADRLVRRWRSAAYFKVSGISMLAGSPFILAALLVQNEWAIFLCLLIGLILAFMNFGPSNAIIINVTDPKIRAAAFAINIFVIHFLGDIPSPPLMGLISDWTESLFWGLSITIPAMVASGIFFCLGAPFMEADQEAVLRELRSSDAKNAAEKQCCT